MFNRRQFIKSICYLSLFSVTNNALKCDGFGPSNSNIAALSMNYDQWIRTLFIGTAKTGARVRDAFQHTISETSRFNEKGFLVQALNPDLEKEELEQFVSKAHFIFLSGSIHDPLFWAVRDVIRKHKIILWYTILVDDNECGGLTEGFTPEKNEILFFVPENNYRHMTSIIDSSISMFLFSCLVHVEPIDVTNALGGKKIFMVKTESSWQDCIELFSLMINEYKPRIEKADSIVLNIMHGHYTDDTERVICALVDKITTVCRPDAELIWASSQCFDLGTNIQPSLFITE